MSAEQSTYQRRARAGEVCTCGSAAIVVYLTENFGEVPYCGVPHPASAAAEEARTLDYQAGYFAGRADERAEQERRNSAEAPEGRS